MASLKERKKLYAREWRKRNPMYGKLKRNNPSYSLVEIRGRKTDDPDYKKKYYLAHAESQKANARNWAKKNPEKSRRYREKWLKANPWITNLANARQRCRNPKATKFEYYGGLGIQCHLTSRDIMKIWKRDMAHKMKQPSLDRKDGHGDYTITNCRFIEMGLNRRLAHVT